MRAAAAARRPEAGVKQCLLSHDIENEQRRLLGGRQSWPQALSKAVRLKPHGPTAGKHARSEAAISIQQDVREQLRQEGALRLTQSSEPQDASAGEEDEEMVPVVEDDPQPTDLSYFGKAFKVLRCALRAVIRSPCIPQKPYGDLSQ